MKFRALAAGGVLAGVLALSGASSAQTPGFSFVAVGDFGVGGFSERATGMAMKRYAARTGADLLATIGDNDYTESPRRFRANWQQSFGWARRSGLEVAGTLGNHDYLVGRGRYEYGLLGMPGAYYTRTIGDAQLFFLNSNLVSARQTAWLEDQLASSTATWKIALFHHPPYTCGLHAGNLAVARSWVPLFERYGVQLVLSGHDHNYQRFRARNGVTYVVDGAGGAGLYSLRRCPSSYPRRARARVVHGFLAITVGEDRLDGYAVDRSGVVRDRFRLLP